MRITKDNDVLTEYNKVWKAIRNKTEETTDDIVEYANGYMKIRLKSSDDLPVGDIVQLNLVTIVIKSVLVNMVNFIHNYFLMMLCILYKFAIWKNCWWWRNWLF